MEVVDKYISNVLEFFSRTHKLTKMNCVCINLFANDVPYIN